MRELSEWFIGAAAKRLSDVEVDANRSNQHEFQATRLVRELLGDTSAKRALPTRFIYLEDGRDALIDDAHVTYYDARARQPNRSAEYRLYYPDNDVTQRASAGDVLVFAALRDGSCVVAIARSSSSAADQLLWLFDLGIAGDTFAVAEPGAFRGALTPIDVNVMLDLFGIEVELDTSADLELVQSRFGLALPSTTAFSEFARQHADGPDPLDDPDGALLAWWSTEYRLFQAFERVLVEDRLQSGFSGPKAVDEFLSFSLSVQNRRKSRSGHALENHTEAVLAAHDVPFTRQARTERGAKPDFLLPGQTDYDDPTFPNSGLRMLATKTTAKDRWRQVVPEADRIRRKHLLSLEPAISTAQTDEMDALGVQLVVPRSIHSSFTDGQQNWLWTLADFVVDSQGLARAT